MEINIAFTEVYEEIENAINDGYRIIINQGTTRSSKTHSLNQRSFLSLLENRMHTQTVMRDTKTACRKIVEKEFIEFLKDPMGRRKAFEDKEISIEQYNKYLKEESLYHLLKHNKSNHTFTYDPTGSVLLFDGADSVDDIIGMGNDVIWINEPYKFDPEVFNQLKQRTRGVIIIDLNPKQTLTWLEQLKDREDTIVLHSTFLKNRFLSTSVRNEILAYQPLQAKFIPKTKEVFYNKYNRENHLDESYDDKFKLIKDIKNKEEAFKEIESIDLTHFQEQQVKRCWNNERQNTASAWHHEVYGLGIKAEAPNRIFSGWTKITQQQYDIFEAMEFWGNDFGVIDPNSLSSVKYKDGCLYVNLQVYKPESKMTYANGTQYDLAEYLLLNSTLKTGDHTYVICDSADNDRYTDESKVEKLRAMGINAFKVSKPRIVERINVLKKLKVFYVANEYLEKEYEGAEWEQVIRNGKIIQRPNPLKPDHALDSIGYVVWNMHQEGYIDLADEIS